MAKAKTSKSTTKTASDKASSTSTKTVDRAAPEGDHTHLASETEEQKMRREATTDSARKAALDAGKKDPIEKWGDPDAKPDQVRRAAFGG